MDLIWWGFRKESSSSLLRGKAYTCACFNLASTTSCAVGRPRRKEFAASNGIMQGLLLNLLMHTWTRSVKARDRHCNAKGLR